MSGLSELSGALRGMSLCRDIEHVAAGNTALASTPSRGLQQVGGSESQRPQEIPWQEQSRRKPPQREGISTPLLASGQALLATESSWLDADIAELKRKYVFSHENAIGEFLLGHRTVTTVLLTAHRHLTESFGADVIFKLEALSYEDEPTYLYAAAIWKGSVEDAESALEAFDERWWLDQSAPAGLIFTYELA